MSTNFYLPGEHEDEDDPAVHIGKRFGAGNGQVGFIWAMHAENAMRKVSEAGGAVDEYGTFVPVQGFVNIVRQCVTHDDRSIGERFS